MSKPAIVGLTLFVVALVAAATGAYFFVKDSNVRSVAQPAPADDRAEDGVPDATTGAGPIVWERTGFSKFTDAQVSNVTDILVDRDGRTVFATYYDENRQSYVASTRDGGTTWSVTKLPDYVINPRALRQLADGSYLLGVSSSVSQPILFGSEDGAVWEAIGSDAADGESLPNAHASSVWDVLELSDGTVLLATDDLVNNVPEEVNPCVYALRDGVIELRGSLQGIGVLSLALGKDGSVYASTQESSEHEDASAAGQAHVYRSTDAGRTWTETGAIAGANRVYQLFANSEGTLFAGTGISGEFYRSTNNGDVWEKMAHVPASVLPRGEDRKMRPLEASRVYSILELRDGRMLVGTGNQAGDVFVTSDEGATWGATGETGINIVAWSLAQTTDGSIWLGTGSNVGDVFVGRP